MAKKPLSALTKDLRKFVTDARAEAGPIIVRSLQIEGPWWTGDFGERWKISRSPIMPTEKPESLTRAWAPGPEARDYPAVGKLRVALEKAMYIGNSVSYAGFAVNRSGATVTRPDGREITYAEHAKERKITPPSKNPRWYDIYTQNGGLLDDLTKAFRAAGAK